MTSETVRIGLIGAGDNTRGKHIPGFRQIDGVELVSVANRTRESSQRVADSFDIPKVYDDWSQLIAAPDTNAICIGTWPNMHRTMVLEALRANKHVLTEARMAMNAAQAREMLQSSMENPHLVAQVVPAPFTFYTEKVVADLIADGYVGDILAVDVTVSMGFIDREAPFTWRHDLDLSGYNVMLLGAVYEPLMRWFGHATSVTAMTKTNVTHRIGESGRRLAVAVPDHAEVLCEMAFGGLMHMRFSAVAGLEYPHQVWIFGSEGTLNVTFDIFKNEDASLNRVRGGRRGDQALSEIEVPADKRGRWRVEEEFVNAIRGLEQVSRTTFEDGVRYMELTEAVTRSAQSHRTVHLPL